MMYRKFFAAWTIGLLSIAGQFAPAQNAKALDHPAKPLLWKIEGGELKQPSWLFGTIHLGRKPLDKLHPEAEKALDASDVIYTEIPMDADTQMAAAMQMIRKDGKTLTASIGEKLAAELDAELKSVNEQLSVQALNMLKTWAVAVTLPMLKEQLAGGTAVDAMIWSKAKAAGKDLKALETADMQMAIFERFPEEQQVAYLAETVKFQKESREKNEDPLKSLIDAYITGDPEKLGTEANKHVQTMLESDIKDFGLKLKKLLIDDRNTSMTVSIGKHLKAESGKTHFFAVGAGHYVGEGNICEQLRKQGYKVTLHQP